MRSALALALVGALLGTACGDSTPSGERAPSEARQADIARKAAFFAKRREAAQALKEERLQDALRLYEEALAIDPAHEGALVDLARTLRELGRRDDALVVLERLRAAHPRLARPWFLIAEILSEGPDPSAEDLRRAVAFYEQALEIEPNVSGPRLGLARAERARGRLGEAEAAYRTVLGTNPDSRDALTGLGLVLLDARRPAEAVPLLVRALEVGTRATGRRDVPSEMDTAESFDAEALEAPANRQALEALARAARALGGYPPEVPQRFRRDAPPR